MNASGPALPSIAIVGAGHVGTAIAQTFAAAGARVTLGVRVPGPVAPKFAPLGIGVRTPADATADAELVFLTVPGNQATRVAEELAGVLASKVVVDCGNPVGRDGQGLLWRPPPEGSLAEAVAARLPHSQVVKGFNTFGAEWHANPRRSGVTAEVMLAGEHDAKLRVAELARAAGFTVVDAGPLRNARLLENLALLWIHLSMERGRDFVITTVQAADPADA